MPTSIQHVNQRLGSRAWPVGRENGTPRRTEFSGGSDRYSGLRAGIWKPRSWWRDFPLCPALGQHQILHVGLARTLGAVEFTPTEQPSASFLACLGGQGQVRVDGRWYSCDARTACLLPAHALEILPVMGQSPWEFCWVCCARPGEQQPARDLALEMAPFDSAPLGYAIEGLVHECSQAAVPTAIQHWADLIQDYFMRFVHRRENDERLGQLWGRVNGELGGEWTLQRLARESGYSYGHLRRLCLREFGRSPMHHVAWLRMRRAAELLDTTQLKIDAVAQAVGYANPFVFSNAFTRWIGWRPSEFRRKHASNGCSVA